MTQLEWPQVRIESKQPQETARKRVLKTIKPLLGQPYMKIYPSVRREGDLKAFRVELALKVNSERLVMKPMGLGNGNSCLQFFTQDLDFNWLPFGKNFMFEA